MVRYRRNYEPGGTYFFTAVTRGREPLFNDPDLRRLLRECLDEVRAKQPFAIDAIVLLPDHLHTVWTLPGGDAAYPMRWKRIKELTNRRAGRGDLWQPRYWEHTCDDADDVGRCVNYIHFNPVRHGYVSRVRDWPWSSFHRFVAAGNYPLEWGEGPVTDVPGAEWE